MNESLRKAIMKCALGCSVSETVEEYGMEEGEMKLVKRKKSKKQLPPDLKAAQMLLSEGEDVKDLDDETLERERKRLMEELKHEEGERGE